MKNYFLPDIKFLAQSCPRNDTVSYLYDKLSAELLTHGEDGAAMAPIRVLSENLHVAPQTIRKIYERLVGDGLLENPAGRKSWLIRSSHDSLNCLGLVLPCSFSNYFQFQSTQGLRHFQIYASLVEKSSEKHLALLPLSLPPPDASDSAVRRSLDQIQKQCRGIIHLGDRGYAEDRALHALCSQSTLPQISFNCRFLFPDISMISFNPEKTVSLFVNYMRELGHRKFAFLTPSPRRPILSWVKYTLTSQEEIRSCFSAAGIEEDDLTLLNFDPEQPQSQQQKLRELLSGEKRPTAVLCRNDDLAIEFMRFCQSMGLSIPRDLSVAGFNNLHGIITDVPPLTTICNPLYELGQALVETLCSIQQYPKSQFLDPHLIVRQSTGPCREKYFL